MPHSKQTGPAFDPTALWRQWYEGLIQTGSMMGGNAEGSKAFSEAASRFFESYVDQYRVARQACETQLHQLQIPTRSDVARVASLVVALEDKVDQLADALDGTVDQPAQPATSAVLSALEERISRIENRLDTLLGAVEKLDANRRTSSKRAPGSNQPSRRARQPQTADGSHGRRPGGRQRAQPLISSA